MGTTTLEPLLTIDEVASYLRKPKKTLYAWRTRGLGPRAMKVGGDLRYKLADVESWLTGQYDGAA